MYITCAGLISDPSESGVLQSMSTILRYTFTGLWVLPVFWVSKPINSIWYQVYRLHHHIAILLLCLIDDPEGYTASVLYVVL